MGCVQVEVVAVGGDALAVVVERVGLPVGLRDAAEGVAVAVDAVLVLVDVVAQVDYVVDRVFADGVAVGVEEALGCCFGG